MERIEKQGGVFMFKPEAIYFEKNIENYELGKELLEKYVFIKKTIDGKEYFFRKEPIIIEFDEKSDII